MSCCPIVPETTVRSPLFLGLANRPPFYSKINSKTSPFAQLVFVTLLSVMRGRRAGRGRLPGGFVPWDGVREARFGVGLAGGPSRVWSSVVCPASGGGGGWRGVRLCWRGLPKLNFNHPNLLDLSISFPIPFFYLLIFPPPLLGRDFSLFGLIFHGRQSYAPPIYFFSLIRLAVC